MPTFLTRSIAFVKERKSWVWPISLVIMCILAFFLIRGCSDPQVDWAKHIQEIEASNKESIAKIEAAHAKEKADLQAHAAQLETELKKSQTLYDNQKVLLDKRKAITVKEIIDRSAGDPTEIARELADEYGFQLVERPESK